MIPNQSRAAKDRVHDYIIEGNWNYGKLADILPIDIVQQIANIPIGKACQEDYAMWEPEEDGYFSTKSAARELIQHKQTDNIRSKVCHSYLPFKISFLVWRLVQKKLPFDDTIGRFGINSVSMCFCCNIKKRETIQHVDSEAAVHLWK